MAQTKELRKFIDQLKGEVMITGDFNAFAENGDHAAMSKILGGKVTLVPSRKTTYRGFQRARQFDLFFVSSGLRPLQPLVVPEVCQPDRGGRERFESFEFYSLIVSDHCPVKLILN